MYSKEERWSEKMGGLNTNCRPTFYVGAEMACYDEWASQLMVWARTQEEDSMNAHKLGATVSGYRAQPEPENLDW